MDTEEGDLHLKPAHIKVLSCQVATSPGKLLEMHIWGPNSSLLDPASLGGAQEAVFYPAATLQVF